MRNRLNEKPMLIVTWIKDEVESSEWPYNLPAKFIYVIALLF